MADSNLYVPPVTTDLWAAIRERLNTVRMGEIFGGMNRISGPRAVLDPPDVEPEEWGRGIVIPGLPASGTRFNPGSGTPISFLWKTEFNNLRSEWEIERSAQLAQLEGFHRLQNWTWNHSSDEVMIALAIRLDLYWEQQLLEDPKTGKAFMSSRYKLEVARAA